MTNRVLGLELGMICQAFLEVSNPLQPITWLVYNSESIDEAGRKTPTYSEIAITARIQPVSKQLIFKYNLELGTIYKSFYVITDTFQVANRNISTMGDYLKYNNGDNDLYYRVMQVPEEYFTKWQHVIGMQTDFIAS